MGTTADLQAINKQGGVQNFLEAWPKLPEKIRKIDPEGCARYEEEIKQLLIKWQFNLNGQQ